MADIRCPKCGRNNPDLLDVCQFCQTPLKSDSVLRIGQAPTRKDTGELEGVLPQWLQDVRQQARASAEEESAQEAAQPKVEKNEPPDLLAGLVSQTNDAGEDDIPDWLKSINPAVSPKPEAPSPPASEPESDFFAQFKQSEALPASKPVQEEPPPAPEEAAAESSDSTDELSQWFSQASEQPEEVVKVDPDAQRQGEPWTGSFDAAFPSRQEPAPQKETEDLSWLHNLEAEAKQTEDLQAPRQDMDWMANFETPAAPSAPAQSQEDLSWLDTLGGIEESPQLAAAQPFAQPPAKKEDENLSWLNNLGAASEPQPFDAAPEKPASARPFVSDEDLSWLNKLGGAAEPSQPAEATSGVSPSPEQDLSWLNQLGGGAESGSQYTPPFAGPESTAQVAPAVPQKEEAEPDWLKSALETPSTPAAEDASLDRFTSKDQPLGERQVPPVEAPPATPSSAPFTDVFAMPGESTPPSGQDIDSLFSADMPDWLSRTEPTMNEPATPEAAPTSLESAASLAPVDLPSWVQAMRPVEAVISETATGTEDQPEEKEGPLAGLRGVIPGMPIGSSIRPKAVALKLQATGEQQASAALLERILDSETNPRALVTSPFIWSQRGLRQVLAVLFWVFLGVIIALRSNAMQVPLTTLPDEMQSASNIVGNIPESGRVLIIVDYEPALAGELEAVGGPVLAHLVLRHPTLSFISTSPSGTGLVERLMTNTEINKPTLDGVEYVAGEQYLNLGYLPGGSAGVLGFVKGPGEIIPAARVQSLSEYAAIILMTDHAESGRVWVEQLYAQKQRDPLLTNQPLLVIASAQADPLLQPYVSSRQINGIVSGLSGAARYEAVNVINASPKTARSYWDAFGIGLAMAIALIVFGSLWSLITGIRARRAEAEQG